MVEVGASLELTGPSETCWTTRRGLEVADNSYSRMDLAGYGRQEAWEDSPSGWPRLAAGRSDDLAIGP